MSPSAAPLERTLAHPALQDSRQPFSDRATCAFSSKNMGKWAGPGFRTCWRPFSSFSADPILINPCLFIWGWFPPKAINKTPANLQTPPHTNKPGFIQSEQAPLGFVPGAGGGSLDPGTTSLRPPRHENPFVGAAAGREGRGGGQAQTKPTRRPYLGLIWAPSPSPLPAPFEFAV